MAVNFAKRYVPPCFGARQCGRVVRNLSSWLSKVFAVMSSTDNCALWSAASTCFRALLSPASIEH
jgi:hypothetical protein